MLTADISELDFIQECDFLGHYKLHYYCWTNCTCALPSSAGLPIPTPRETEADMALVKCFPCGGDGAAGGPGVVEAWLRKGRGPGLDICR